MPNLEKRLKDGTTGDGRANDVEVSRKISKYPALIGLYNYVLQTILPENSAIKYQISPVKARLVRRKASKLIREFKGALDNVDYHWTRSPELESVRQEYLAEIYKFFEPLNKYYREKIKPKFTFLQPK